MNRPIKFRAWTGYQMEYKIMAGYLGSFYCDGMNKNDSACMSDANTIYGDNTPIMQSTSLKDKHGKDIYEGDIVLATKDSGAKTRKGKIYYVYFNQKMSHYGMIEKSSYQNTITYNLDLYKEGYDTVQLSRPKSNAIEIIGNIYENPNLLK